MADNKNQVTKNDKPKSIVDYLTAPLVKQQIANVVGKTNSQRFISSIVSAVQANPALAECTQKSILNCALLGETLGLSPSPQLGQYYMVPYNNTKTGVKEAQYQLGYRGYIQMAIRSGEYSKMNVVPIKEGELKSWDPINEEIVVDLIDDEAKRLKAKTVGYYGMFAMNNGFKKAMYWTYDKMLNHANEYSKGFAAKKGYTFWEKDFDSMACKTLIRQLISKWGVMSPEMQKAYKADMAVISSDINDRNSDFEVDYVDNAVPQFDNVTGEVIEAEAKVIDLASPTQIKSIEEHLDEKNIAEMLKHYGVNKVEELNALQASEVIKSILAQK